ncbi:hypothetical protein [Occallatibacter savannae]|uniref:hypothetical protein n=1 Tax=Occallatibacter savannae TaxID=1002691 RepID=UPI000D689BF5|nr:hypothetical protein [Occallatibacter savannae]
MRKIELIVSAVDIPDPRNHRAVHMELAISQIRRNCVRLPDELKEPMIRAIEAYANGVPVVVQDERDETILFGKTELLRLSATPSNPKPLLVFTVCLDQWSSSEAPKFLEEARRNIYLRGDPRAE